MDDKTIKLDGGAANDNGREEIEPMACTCCRVHPAVISGLCGECFCLAEAELTRLGFDWNGERF